MSILLLLIPLGLGLVSIALWAFIWAVDHDQFDDSHMDSDRVDGLHRPHPHIG